MPQQNKKKYATFKIRIADQKDSDFVEVNLSRKKLKYNELILAICSELNVKPKKIERLRKLPNTKLRKDKEIQRLRDFTELEIVLLKTVHCLPNITFQTGR